jgi:hypothetical protein
MALYHEWFGDFCLRMRQAFEMTKNGEGIDREGFNKLKDMLDPQSKKMIQDETLEFIKVNMNHLPMYYIPGEEFP